MTWTYSNDPTASSKDEVRFLVGDTRESDPQLSDEEVLWLVGQEGNALRAAVRAAETLAAKYAREVDKSIGSLSLSASSRSEHYRTLATSLRARADIVVAPYAGGLSQSDKDAREADTDLVKPAFARDLQEYAGTDSFYVDPKES